MAESVNERIIASVLAELPHWDDEPDTVYAARIAARVVGPVLGGGEIDEGVYRIRNGASLGIAAVNDRGDVVVVWDTHGRSFTFLLGDVREKYEWRRLYLPEFPPVESEEEKSDLVSVWRLRAAESRKEAGRLRRTIKEPTDAEERCNVRAGIWEKCADELERDSFGRTVPPEMFDEVVDRTWADDRDKAAYELAAAKARIAQMSEEISDTLRHNREQAAEIARLKATLARARELCPPVWDWTPEEEAFWGKVDPVEKEKQ